MSIPRDVVLVNDGGPQPDGLTALTEIRAHDPDLPVILVSDRVDDERAAAAVRAGGNDYISLGELGRLAWSVERSRRNAEVRRALRRAEEDLRKAEQRYHALFQASPIGIELVNERGVLTEVNPAFQEMLGYSSDELVGRHWTDMTFPEDVDRETELDREMDAGTRTHYQLVKRFVRKDGGIIWARLSSSDVGRIAAGDFQFSIGMVEDITLQMRTHEALRESEERYRTVVEATPDGIAIVDLQGTVQFANRQFARMLGFASPAHVLGRPGLEFVFADDREIAETELTAIVRRGYAANIRVRQVRTDSTVFPAQFSGALVRDEHGAPAGILAVMRDISDQAAYEDQLRRLALYDTLTNIPNRTLLMDRLSQALAATRIDDEPLALLLMDLDNFKEINDTYGHQLGDAVLAEVARRLETTLRDADTLARLGGDEFGIVLPNVDLLGSLQTVSQLISALEQPIELGDQLFHVGASIGIAIAPDHAESAEGLLRLADVAMYEAKRTNSGYAVYAPEKDAHGPLRIAVINELRVAVERDQLLLHFQPKMNLTSGLYEGVEALVRWHHPDHGVIPPDQFISIAEHSGLIRPLTNWVIRRAVEQCGQWRALGLDLGVAVNFSARSLHDPDLPRTLGQYLTQAGVPAARLTVEITESVLMAEPERAMAVLLHLKRLGVRISIDDFGTGYSSLGYLRQLHADELKIDKSFVRDLTASGDGGAIVQAVVDMGHKLGLEVVGEGVESQRVLDLLNRYHCDWAQGYHLSRPQAGSALTAWLQGHASVRRLSP